MSKFTFIDLFAGIGGFRLGLNRVGGECLAFSEKANDAIKTYCDNYQEKDSCNLGDITKIKALPEHDLLTGGVPCQSWSIAGKNLGFDDDRGQLWNDTIYLLNQAKPKAFMFENVKGLIDPRNQEAFEYILNRIEEAGYYAKYYLINSFDYGVPQARVRVFLIGFKNKVFAEKFKLPEPIKNHEELTLSKILGLKHKKIKNESFVFTSNAGFTNYFMLNDLRNGDATIHSWDILNTTQRQKDICQILLTNRRKKIYGPLDGNPLSLEHFQNIDESVTQGELDKLVELKILKEELYGFTLTNEDLKILDEAENLVINGIKEIMSLKNKKDILVDELKNLKEIKKKNIKVAKIMQSLVNKKILNCHEIRYDFKNTKISTGLFGINRIFLPNANIFPTLVASDTNDYLATELVEASSSKDFKQKFIEQIYNQGKFRKITKEEACLMQGFPQDFQLPENRARWMKLVGNSVSVPVIEQLGQAIVDTGVFE